MSLLFFLNLLVLVNHIIIFSSNFFFFSLAYYISLRKSISCCNYAIHFTLLSLQCCLQSVTYVTMFLVKSFIVYTATTKKHKKVKKRKKKIGKKN